MIQNHYDVIALGRTIESLTAASLLAKRGYRVLVVGQDQQPHTDNVEDYRLYRRPSTFTAASSQVVNRVMRGLALQDFFRRSAFMPEPRFQIALPEVRVDVGSTAAERSEEYARAFPDSKRSLEEMERYVTSLVPEQDAVLGQDIVWPPATFRERRDFARSMAQHSFGRDGRGTDPLMGLRSGSGSRHLFELPVQFSSHLSSEQHSSFVRTRLLSLWLSGCAHMRGGLGSLTAALEDKLTTYGGTIRRGDRVDKIRVKRGQITGVRIATTEEELGATFVLPSMDISALVRLLPDRRVLADYFDRHGEPQLRHYRYVLNLAIRPEGFPPGMGPELFYVHRSDRPMHSENLLRIHRQPDEEHADYTQLTVEALLPWRKPRDRDNDLLRFRERVLASLRGLLPFLDRHLLVVDSPSDGRDAELVQKGTLVPSTVPWSRGPASMERIYHLTPGVLGVVGLPSRMPIRGLLLTNRQVLPALGLEGQILVARSVARIVGQSDRRKEWMRSRLWTKAQV